MYLQFKRTTQTTAATETTMTAKLTPAKLTVLNEIATAGFVRGKTAQLRDLRAAGLIEYGAVWPVVAKDNYATLTEAGLEVCAAERVNQTRRTLVAMLKKSRASMRALDERIARNRAVMEYLDEMALSLATVEA
jgi:hypothetical protein